MNPKACFPRIRDVVWLACVTLTLCVASTASAQQPCERLSDRRQCPQAAAFETARGLGLGTGARASAISTSALAYSPGALSLGNLYHLEGTIDYLAEFNTVALGGAAVDSSTSKVGAGIALRGFLSGDDGWGGLDGRLGLAFPFSDAFSVGLLGRYVDITAEGVNANGDPVNVDLAQGLTMDAGIRIIPTDGLQLDLAAQNFIDLDSAYAPTVLSGSLAFAMADSFSLGADLLADMTSFDTPALTLGGGLEFLAGAQLPLRGGYIFDVEREIHTVSAGLGYTDAQVGLDLAFQQQVAGGEGTRIMAAMRYYVQ
ncbi:MAG: hypothetical protein PVI30_15385 [Myxococcales bacterium]